MTVLPTLWEKPRGKWFTWPWGYIIRVCSTSFIPILSHNLATFHKVCCGKLVIVGRLEKHCKGFNRRQTFRQHTPRDIKVNFNRFRDLTIVENIVTQVDSVKRCLTADVVSTLVRSMNLKFSCMSCGVCSLHWKDTPVEIIQETANLVYGWKQVL